LAQQKVGLADDGSGNRIVQSFQKGQHVEQFELAKIGDGHTLDGHTPGPLVEAGTAALFTELVLEIPGIGVFFIFVGLIIGSGRHCFFQLAGNAFEGSVVGQFVLGAFDGKGFGIQQQVSFVFRIVAQAFVGIHHVQAHQFLP